MSQRSSTPPSESPRASGVFDEKAPIAPMSPAAAFGWAFVVTVIFLGLWSIAGMGREESKSDLIVSFGSQVVAYSLGLFLILRVYAPQRSIRDFIAIRAPFWPLLLVALVLGVCLTAPADAIYSLICARWPSPIDPDTLDKTFMAASFGRRIAMGVVLCAAGPFLEEVFFRGALLRPLKRSVGPWVAILVTAVLFAVIHLEWQMFAPIFVLGLCLGFLRQWSSSLFVSFVVHGAFNGVAFASLLRESTGANPIVLSLPMTLGATAVSAALMAIAYVISSKSSNAERAREADA